MTASSHAAPRRLSPTAAAFALGLPVAAAVLGLFHFGPLRRSFAFRYVEYPVQWAEVVFFCCALGALLAKVAQLRQELAACWADVLPRWDGKPVPAERAADLMASIDRQPARVQDTYLGRRLRAVLEYLCQRRSAAGLDEQMRALSDNDAMAQENSFALLRFITWAIPILGFLGTVVGITGAIAGVTPEALENSMSDLTNGLAEAFDSTALALGLTMVCMFLTYLVERQEQAVLETVGRVIDRQLAHRFERGDEGARALTATVEGVVKRQAELWAEALAEPQRRAAEMMQQAQAQLLAGLAEALERSLAAHGQRLAEVEAQTAQAGTQIMQQLAGMAIAVRDTGREQQQSLARVADGVAAQAAALAKLQEGAGNLVHLQAVLHQNLAALASASDFEEAVHSLTAAVHLLTSRAGAPAPRLHHGKAA
jgi:biopolymer transport protein ExbB/TolQ